MDQIANFWMSIVDMLASYRLQSSYLIYSGDEVEHSIKAVTAGARPNCSNCRATTNFSVEILMIIHSFERHGKDEAGIKVRAPTVICPRCQSEVFFTRSQ